MQLLPQGCPFLQLAASADVVTVKDAPTRKSNPMTAAASMVRIIGYPRSRD
jgi:hypothetical protein